MLKNILFAILILLVALGLYVSAQPPEMLISRSLLIPVPASQVFAQVNDFKNWANWSPWTRLDPNQKIEFSGAANGEGAVMTWNGNKDVGQGRNAIVQSRAPEFIQTKLEFIKPFKSTSTAEFTFEEKGKETLVTWTMLAQKNFIMKTLHLVIDCDKMIGAQFEEGLSNLKNTVQ